MCTRRGRKGRATLEPTFRRIDRGAEIVIDRRRCVRMPCIKRHAEANGFSRPTRRYARYNAILYYNKDHISLNMYYHRRWEGHSTLARYSLEARFILDRHQKNVDVTNSIESIPILICDSSDPDFIVHWYLTMEQADG